MGTSKWKTDTRRIQSIQQSNNIYCCHGLFTAQLYKREKKNFFMIGCKALSIKEQNSTLLIGEFNAKVGLNNTGYDFMGLEWSRMEPIWQIFMLWTTLSLGNHFQTQRTKQITWTSPDCISRQDLRIKSEQIQHQIII